MSSISKNKAEAICGHGVFICLTKCVKRMGMLSKFFKISSYDEQYQNEEGNKR